MADRDRVKGSGSQSAGVDHQLHSDFFSATTTMQINNCTINLSCVDGPHAREIFLSCQPSAEITDPAEQARSVYDAISSVLNAQGGSFNSIASETIFHRDIRANFESVRDARRQVIGQINETAIAPATVEIEQASLNAHASFETLIQAVIPQSDAVEFKTIECASSCDCSECTSLRGLKFEVGDDTRFCSDGIYGKGTDAYQQTLTMFEEAEALLKKAGMQFSDVVRTWIYFSEMDRDYADFNRARREFFKERKIEPAPASTGIGAGLIAERHDIYMCLHALKSEYDFPRVLMTTPTLNEAPSYGADFSRGMRVEDSNKQALYLSGTASLDEEGVSVHLKNLDAQMDRMLVNIATLLKAQNASIDDVVSATTYLKQGADADHFKKKLQQSGYDGFAHNIVIAPVCRPELLCETEAFAVLKKNNS